MVGILQTCTILPFWAYFFFLNTKSLISSRNTVYCNFTYCCLTARGTGFIILTKNKCKPWYKISKPLGFFVREGWSIIGPYIQFPLLSMHSTTFLSDHHRQDGHSCQGWCSQGWGMGSAGSNRKIWVYPAWRKESLLGRPYCYLQIPDDRDDKEKKQSDSLVVHSSGMRDNRHRLEHEKLHLDIKKPLTKRIRLTPDVAEYPACRNLVKLDLLWEGGWDKC